MRIAVLALRRRDSRLLQALGFFGAAIALAVLTYAFTLQFGFDYDDYHLLHPYTVSEVASAFVGHWDPSGIEVPFYRPLTTAFYAARFWVLGVDAWKYHALGLVMFGVAAMLFGLFVAAVAESRLVGLLAVVVYVVHPAMARSQVVWTTNQMHLLSSLLVGTALVWWAGRGRAGRGWGWAVLAALAVLLVKEDGIMLLPLLVALQVLWRLLVDRNAAWPPLGWLALGFAALGGTLALRHAALGGLGGYSGMPPVGRMWDNYRAGARVGFLGMRTDRWFLWPWSELFTRAILVGGALSAVARRDAHLGFLLIAGALGAAFFNLPFVFVTKPEQYHLVASFSAVSIASAIALVWRLVPARSWQVTIGAVSVAGLLVLCAASRHRAELFRPYTPWTLGHDAIVIEWSSVPLEIRGWLREGLRDRRQPAIGRLSNLPVIVFGASDYEVGPDGVKARWLGERTVILPAANVRALDLPLTAMTPLKHQRFRVVVDAPHGRVADLTLNDGDSVTVRVPLRDRLAPFPLSRRVTVRVTPGWRLRDVVPGADDEAVRTVRLGEVRFERSPAPRASER